MNGDDYNNLTQRIIRWLNGKSLSKEHMYGHVASLWDYDILRLPTIQRTCNDDTGILGGTMNEPSLTFRLINEFGDGTTILKKLSNTSLEEVIPAIRECLLACGFQPESLDDYFRKEEQ